MIGLKIWERYFIKDVLKLFALFLVLFYGLYVLIDYTGHTSDFVQMQFSVLQIGFYYLCHFVMRLEVLVPFALMIASMRTLCQLNLNNELVAMTASGIKLKRLARPFMLIALAGVALLYANFQFALPYSNLALERMKDGSAGKSKSSKEGAYVHSIPLKDGTVLLYQSYDNALERFFDLYWIHSADELYHMKHLYPGETSSKARLVDHLKRGPDGSMELLDSHDSMTFEALGFEDDVIQRVVLPTDAHSISALWRRLPDSDRKLMDEEAELLSRFHFMLAIPWICLLAVLGPMPFCVRFTRQFNVLFRYAIAIVGFLGFFTILNATRVLGEHQAISPVWGIWAPFALYTPVLIYFYARMR